MDVTFLSGSELEQIGDWATHLCQEMEGEPHLLSQQPQDLRDLGAQGRLIVAFDQEVQHAVGCVALWPLAEHDGEHWGELGTLFVQKGWRFVDRGESVVDGLYARLLQTFPEVNIVETTTSMQALKAGRRAQLVHIGFHRLPRVVREATCICGPAKTGLGADESQLHCPKANTICYARVSPHTHQRCGSPEPLPLPV